MARDVVTQLDNFWNEGYQLKDISIPMKVLADDWTAFTPDNQVVTKQQLFEAIPSNPEARLEFDEFEIHLFGDTAITKGRLTAHHTDGQVRQQRFLRVYAKRNQEWKAVTAQVIPMLEKPPEDEIEALWLEEAERRIDLVDQGKMRLISGEEVRKRTRGTQ